MLLLRLLQLPSVPVAEELSAKGYNKRSSEHLNLYGNNDFNKEMHAKYLGHEDINNLKGLKIEMIYNLTSKLQKAYLEID
mgnify:CR=1 FL=1